MNRFRKLICLSLSLTVFAMFLGGCSTPKKDPAEREREEREARARRQEWFKNAAGKPISEQRSIETELLTEDPAALSEREKPSNPYPIYRENPQTVSSEEEPKTILTLEDSKKIKTK